MPIKDPEERRRYQANLMRQRRAKVANAGIARPTPAKGKRRPAPLAANDCALSDALLSELARADAGPSLTLAEGAAPLNPFAWEQDKATLGWALLCKGKGLVNVDPETAIKLIKQGSEMVESCLPVLRAENDDDAQGVDWASILTADKMDLLTELLVESHNKGTPAAQ